MWLANICVCCTRLQLLAALLRPDMNCTMRHTSTTISFFSHIPMGPPDPILGLIEMYSKSTHPKKMDLSIGAYRDLDGNPWVLPTVREAEKRLFQRQVLHEYEPISGDRQFCTKAVELALGKDSDVLKMKRNATVQALSGTGALRLGANFLYRYWKGNRHVYVPQETWPNHTTIFVDAGLKVSKYRYFDKETCGLDIAGLLEDLTKIKNNSVVVLQACAHNPTGVDPTVEQWGMLSKLFKEKNFLAFFDMAYQGFASGNCDKDAYSVRFFVSENIPFLLGQSFAKNMGLYGERVGALTCVCKDESEAQRVKSQLKILIRAMYSNPPAYGARLALEILTNEDLHQKWQEDLKQMSNRIAMMRGELRRKLEELGSKVKWDHITKQIGMFCLSGLTEKEVVKLALEYGIFMPKNGRIPIVGVTPKNIDYLAQSMHEVTK